MKDNTPIKNNFSHVSLRTIYLRRQLLFLPSWSVFYLSQLLISAPRYQEENIVVLMSMLQMLGLIGADIMSWGQQSFSHYPGGLLNKTFHFSVFTRNSLLWRVVLGIERCKKYEIYKNPAILFYCWPGLPKFHYMCEFLSEDHMHFSFTLFYSYGQIFCGS